jgi:spore coat protein CotH
MPISVSTAAGEYLALIQPDGSTIEHEYAAVPKQFPDISYGLQTHGANPTLRAGLPGYLIHHTPGLPNACIPAPHPLYSDHSPAQIDIEISQDDWTGLMEIPPDDAFRPAGVRFRHGDVDLTVSNAGIRCRGASTRGLQPRSFTVSFNAFVPGQKLLDMERLELNATAVDPSSTRSKLVHDLHAAAGVPVAYANFAALVVHGPDWDRTNEVDGVFFDAIRLNTQPVDEVFLNQRFGNSRGNLYKDSGPAPLAYLGPDGSAYVDQGYILQHAGSGETSLNDLADFIATINQTPDADFPHAIMQALDVDGFIKCLALTALTGNYDSYWLYGHNYRLYRHPDTRRWVYLPYDFDLTFGINWGSTDWARQHVYFWTNVPGAGTTPLAARILADPEFRGRYSFYLKQMLDTVYTNAVLDPALFHCRSAMAGPLPFPDSVSVPNLKERERLRYVDDWPNWTYSHFWNSFTHAQTAWDYGLTSFIGTRSASARSQMSRGFTMSPILSDFILTPAQPDIHDPVMVSIRAIDDVSVSSVMLYWAFQNGPTNAVPMVLQPAGHWSALLPAFGTTGTLHYLVRAEDNTGRTTFHPYGGSNHTATARIGSSGSQLVVTELNYNPCDPTPAEIAAGFSDPRRFEFVELHNTGGGPMDLAGFGLTDGIGALFPSFILGAGEFAVVVNDTNAFRFRYPDSAIRIIGTFSGNLSNGGETIRLEDPAGDILASISYSDSGAWPGRADGDGSTLELIDPDAGYAHPGNWRSSSEYGGSPGAPGLGPDNRIVINEVLTHTDPPLSDAIELFNSTDEAIAIGGWFLSDAKSNYRKYPLPVGTILPAGGYLVFNETNHFNTSAGADTNDFALNGARGGNVFLLATDAHGNLARFIDRVEFGAAANGESFGRWPNGSGRLCPMISRTFGAANSGPRIGPVILSELMYNPPSGSNHLEFVEILNPAETPVDLANWQLAGGVTFAFPSNSTLSPGGVLVILAFDPAASSNTALLADFRTTYAISTNVPLTGPYSGTLSDAGERLLLLRPDEPPPDEPGFFPLLTEDEVAYGHETPWPLSPDGGGASLGRLNPSAWGDTAASWLSVLPPTPGSPRPTISAYQDWAARHGIVNLLATNPDTGVPYVEEFLLETNTAPALHLPGSSMGFSLYTHLPALDHGIATRIEISTNLNLPAWRVPADGELILLSNQTYRIGVTSTPVFIRLQLIPRP